MRPITTFQEAEAALLPFLPSRLKRLAYTTDHMRAFMEYLGNPQNIPRSIHVAGTSGKTSTAYYAASLLQQADKKTGLLTSPHVRALNDRIQIDLEPLPEKEFCEELALFLGLVTKSGITLTYNEVLYAFAFWEFARHGVEYIVIETGLGGLLDATNVISRTDKLCIITDIGRDHTKVLGGTLEEIARHKAGIISLHNTVFCYTQPAGVLHEIQTACRHQQADLHILDAREPGISGLPPFQQRNAALALQAVQFALGRDGQLTDSQTARAVQIAIPGRMERIRAGTKTIILDGAHNAQKLEALRSGLVAIDAGRPVAVLAALTDRPADEVQESVKAITAFAAHLITTTLPAGKDGRAALSAEALARSASQAGGQSVQVAADRRTALRLLLDRPEPILVITGSFYLLQDVRPLMIALPNR